MDAGRHLKHPSVQRSWSRWSENETLHVAVAYSNPFRFQNRRVLLENFRRRMSAFPNVELYIGELAYGERPFEVTGLDHDAPMEPQIALFHQNDVQLRTTDEMFHKENILNAVLTRWPEGWKWGAVVDGDMIFTRHDWALESIHLLQHYDFVQLFSSYVDLSSTHEPYTMARSFAWNYHHQDAFLETRKRRHPPHPHHGSGSGGHGKSSIREDIFPFGFDPGAPGGAWAFRRPAMKTVGRLLDVNILGGGDSEMAHGLVGAVKSIAQRTASPQPRAETDGTANHALAVLNWQKNASKLNKNIGYLDQYIVHPFHGSKQRRHYFERWALLRKHDFNPFTDLVADYQGIYHWAGDKPALRDDVRKYFISRSEDDPNLYGSEKPIL